VDNSRDGENSMLGGMGRSKTLGDIARDWKWGPWRGH